MAYYSGLYSLNNQDWIKVFDLHCTYQKVIQIKHRDVWITNIIDFDDLRIFIDFVDFHKKAMKEINIYLDMIWG